LRRYLALVEGSSGDPGAAKTAYGVLRYGDAPVVAMLDSEAGGTNVAGVPVVASVSEAVARHSPTVALVGVAPAGGVLDRRWRDLILECIESGLDIESGLHVFLGEDEEFRAAAAEHAVELRDLRRPPDDLEVLTGEGLTADARVVFTVGSDCNAGKMTAAIELDREARSRGLRSAFVPTGQTGIAIAGWGIAIDAVVSDFIAGAAERLVLQGARNADLLWIEGQGSLVNQMYSGVTLGLYHGSAPHCTILCHVAGQTAIEDLPEQPIPPLAELVELHERLALPVRPAKVAAVALNTRLLSDDQARLEIARCQTETGLPVDDPVRFGPGILLDAVLNAVGSVETSAVR
jgi:uncharacterized NAD-dependent epimerase/dehydratase family protein